MTQFPTTFSHQKITLDDKEHTKPGKEWRCQDCLRCWNCGKTQKNFPISLSINVSIWRLDFKACLECYSKVSCPICLQRYSSCPTNSKNQNSIVENYNKVTSKILVKCEECKCWMHAACLGYQNIDEIEFVQKSGPGIICPPCQNRLSIKKSYIKAIQVKLQKFNHKIQERCLSVFNQKMIEEQSFNFVKDFDLSNLKNEEDLIDFHDNKKCLPFSVDCDKFDVGSEGLDNLQMTNNTGNSLNKINYLKEILKRKIGHHRLDFVNYVDLFFGQRFYNIVANNPIILQQMQHCFNDDLIKLGSLLQRNFTFKRCESINQFGGNKFKSKQLPGPFSNLLKKYCEDYEKNRQQASILSSQNSISRASTPSISVSSASINCGYSIPLQSLPVALPVPVQPIRTQSISQVQQHQQQQPPPPEILQPGAALAALQKNTKIVQQIKLEPKNPPVSQQQKPITSNNETNNEKLDDYLNNDNDNDNDGDLDLIDRFLDDNQSNGSDIEQLLDALSDNIGSNLASKRPSNESGATTVMTEGGSLEPMKVENVETKVEILEPQAQTTINNQTKTYSTKPKYDLSKEGLAHLPQAARNAIRASAKWEVDEPLGDDATIAPVLYANMTQPNLRIDFPDWKFREKQIQKFWRRMTADEKKPYLDLAKENRQKQLKIRKQESGKSKSKVKNETELERVYRLF